VGGRSQSGSLPAGKFQVLRVKYDAMARGIGSHSNMTNTARLIRLIFRNGLPRQAPTPKGLCNYLHPTTLRPLLIYSFHQNVVNNLFTVR